MFGTTKYKFSIRIPCFIRWEQKKVKEILHFLKIDTTNRPFTCTSKVLIYRIGTWLANLSSTETSSCEAHLGLTPVLAQLSENCSLS